jgi:hypothetical protein
MDTLSLLAQALNDFGPQGGGLLPFSFTKESVMFQSDKNLEGIMARMI